MTSSTPKTVVLATYYSVHEAELICANLRGAGIHAQVEGQHAVGVLPMHALALGGVRVVVPASQLAEAQELLADLASAVDTNGEVESDAEPATDAGDAQMKQAAFTAFLGLCLCPVVGTLYSLILLARHRGLPLSSRGTTHRRLAVAFDVIAVGALIAWRVALRTR